MATRRHTEELMGKLYTVALQRSDTGIDIGEIAYVLDVSNWMARYIVRKLRLELDRSGQTVQLIGKRQVGGQKFFYRLTGDWNEALDWWAYRFADQLSRWLLDKAMIGPFVRESDPDSDVGRLLRRIQRRIGDVLEDVRDIRDLLA